jgi:hypothetical protein
MEERKEMMQEEGIWDMTVTPITTEKKTTTTTGGGEGGGDGPGGEDWWGTGENGFMDMQENGENTAYELTHRIVDMKEEVRGRRKKKKRGREHF